MKHMWMLWGCLGIVLLLVVSYMHAKYFTKKAYCRNCSHYVWFGDICSRDVKIKYITSKYKGSTHEERTGRYKPLTVNSQGTCKSYQFNFWKWFNNGR